MEKSINKFTNDKENVDADMRKKVKQLSQHVEKQEGHYRDLISSREAHEEQIRSLSESNLQLQNRNNIATAQIHEFESLLAGISNKLREGGITVSGDLLNDVGGVVAQLQKVSDEYSAEVARLREINEETRENSCAEKDKFEQISSEYYERISQMNRQIERLNSAVDANEENSTSIHQKCQDYEDQIKSLQDDSDKKSQEYMRVIQV